MRTRALITACAAAVLILVIQAYAQTPAELFSEAEGLFAQGKYAEAKQKFEELWQLSDNPKRGETWVRLLGCHKWLKENQELESFFQSNLLEFKGTVHEAEARFVRADAIRDNLKDSRTALAEFQYILDNFPTAPNAAPGSLYRIGLIQLEDLQDYSEAISKFDDVISRFGQSPYVARSYLNIMKASAKLKDIARMETAFTELQQKFPDWRGVIGEGWLVKGEFQWKEINNKLVALKCYQKVIDEYPNSYGLPLALVRVADIVPYGNIDKSIEYYQRVIREFPKYWEAKWAQTELGVCYYLKNELTSATLAFERVSQITTAPKYTNKARMYLEAIKNPKTVAGLICRYDAGVQHFRNTYNIDWALDDHARVVQLAREPFFEDYLTSAAVSEEDRAQMLYRLAFSYFQVGRLEQAHDTASQVLARYSGARLTADEARFLMSFITYRWGEIDQAIEQYNQLLEASPNCRFASRVLYEIGKCNENKRDFTNAAISYNRILEAFPCSPEARGAIRRLAYIEDAYPEDYKAFEQYVAAHTGTSGSSVAEATVKAVGEEQVLPEKTPAVQRAVKSVLDRLGLVLAGKTSRHGQ